MAHPPASGAGGDPPVDELELELELELEDVVPLVPLVLVELELVLDALVLVPLELDELDELDELAELVPLELVPTLELAARVVFPPDVVEITPSASSPPHASAERSATVAISLRIVTPI